MFGSRIRQLPLIEWFASQYLTWIRTRTPLALTVALLLIGLLEICFGYRVVASFEVTGADTTVRIMGVMFTLGSSMAIRGFIKRDALLEAVGLSVSAAGSLVYALGTLIAFGMSGLATFLGFLGISVTLFGNVVFTSTLTKGRLRREKL